MLRREMIPMTMGSTPMHMMLDDQFESSSLYFFPFSFPPLICMYELWIWIMEECMWIGDYEHLICHMCYFFPFLLDELMTEFENFECWIIFSYFCCVWSLWSMEYGLMV
ncbi:hypothetical protein AMTRI_Chr07g23350 [Amborella trichopoda]